MKKFIIIAFVVLAACTNSASDQITVMRKIERDAGSELKTCRAKIYDNPQYAPIIKHYPPEQNLAAVSQDQFTGDALPSEGEAKLLLKMHDELLPCRQVFLSKTQNNLPGLTKIYTDEWAQNDAITMQLVQRKITWGQALGERQRIKFETNQKLLNQMRK